MPEHTIEQVDDGSEGAFVIANPDGEPRYFAEMTYYWRDGTMVIVHTGVRPELQRQGVARKLVNAAIAHARDRGFRIDPKCPYAASVFDKDPEGLSDVLFVRG